MLIEFTVGNYRSFREPVTLSMEAAAITSEDKRVDDNNTIPVRKGLTLLTSAAIYGANASGKSNLINAMGFMRDFILDSSRESQAEDPIRIEPFRLSTTAEQQPSLFELVFLIGNQRYRYGFEVTRESVVREWLYYTPSTREAELFMRHGAEIKVNARAYREGRGLEEKTRQNALFLSVVAQFNGPISKKIRRKIREIGLISGLSDMGYRSFTLENFSDDEQTRETITNLVRSLDVGIEDILVNKRKLEKFHFPSEMPEPEKQAFIKNLGLEYSTRTTHTKFDLDNQPVGTVEFDLEDNESEGTQKLFYLSGPILHTLNEGRVLIVDEMEARMHPLITCAIIHLFNSIETNPKRAQLIFTTHDTNLLDRTIFRRDQIWFSEKDSYGATHLYSLVEFKPRNDESYERNYLRGKYGAIPYVGDISRTIIVAEQPVAEAQDDAA